jgi:serine/threonine-protein kinase
MAVEPRAGPGIPIGIPESRMSDAPDPDATGAYRPDGPHPPPAERFAPGTLLAGRYRVVAALGKGGMGEVYRADDLTLGQPVALKFLPPHLAADPDRLARFRKEVAAARRVSHPNVCRVYDIAEDGGRSFLSMEFVDGEDLVSALRRLGRLPEEKGVEVARQLCAALAAVHDQGLVHRDLKPANVMLDGRGRVRLTDFGLAAAAADLSATEVRSGTPLYQAPEQLAGMAVTVRSDLFALGLVLYELFTGKRAFADARRDTPPSKPSSHLSSLDPAVERVILRCLEPDPANRPRSAVEVLAGLPGGDPLAAALAAGETPSPRVVADAGEVGLIRPWVGAATLAFVVVGLIGSAFLNDRVHVFPPTPLAVSPADQDRTARQLLAECGANARPVDAASAYTHERDVISRVAGRDPSPDRFRYLAGGRTHSTHYYYRQSPQVWLWVPGYVTADRPTPVTPDEAVVRLDARGRLLELLVVPPRELPDAAPGPADWAGPLLRAAGFGPGDTVTPDGARKWTPPVYADAGGAWVIRTADGQTLRAEAAALRGRPVWFHLSDERERPPVEDPPIRWWGGAISLAMLGVVIALAVRNLRRGRGDRRGAAVAAAVIGTGTLAAWVVGGLHFPAVGSFGGLVPIFGLAAFSGLVAAVGYLALEPVVRRRWPWRLTAWSRLVAGRVRDPLVGRDLLAGVTAAVVGVILFGAFNGAESLLGVHVQPATAKESMYPGGYRVFPGVGHALGLSVTAGVRGAFAVLVVAFVVGLLVRREWLVWLAYILFVAASSWQPGSWADAVKNMALAGVVVFVLARFGLLALCAYFVGVELSVRLPPTADPGSWHFGQGAAGVLVFLLLAGYGAYTATGGRLFKESFFGDD